MYSIFIIDISDFFVTVNNIIVNQLCSKVK